MIILDKSDCILFYSVNPNYFNTFDLVYCESDSHSYWRTAEANTSVFTYDCHFSAKDKQGNDSFIEYRGRMVCILKIENQEEDAMQMLTLIKGLHSSMNMFIKSNCLSYFPKLTLHEYEITDRNVTTMQKSIAQLKEMKLHENKSDDERIFEKKIEDIQFNVRVVKTKIGG